MNLTGLQKKIFEYQKSGDAERLSVLRFLLASLKNREIELRVDGQEISQEDVIKIINKQMKQRKESVEIYQKGGRDDLSQKEGRELVILEEFLKYAESL